MNSAFFKAMKAKKKREIDPNAPPRPNLMTHNVKLRDQDNALTALRFEVNSLKDAVSALKSKLEYQNSYIQLLHSKLQNK